MRRDKKYWFTFGRHIPFSLRLSLPFLAPLPNEEALSCAVCEGLVCDSRLWAAPRTPAPHSSFVVLRNKPLIFWVVFSMERCFVVWCSLVVGCRVNIALDAFQSAHLSNDGSGREKKNAVTSTANYAPIRNVYGRRG